MMTDIYQRIDGSEYRNIFVVGDIHGCYSRLMSQISELKFDHSKDLLVSVGDLIDRGPQSLQCLELINEEWFRCVRGNHEQMAIDTLAEKTDGRLWFHNGGDWFMHLDGDQQMYAGELIALAAKLPLVIELKTASAKIVVAHADYPDSSYEFGKSVCEEDLVWSRDRFNNIVDGIGGEITGADQFYFGHTPIKQQAKAWNQNYIDTGAVFGGQLTIVQVQGGKNG
jgi:serine/threonine protein phosphatase 1